MSKKIEEKSDADSPTLPGIVDSESSVVVSDKDTKAEDSKLHPLQTAMQEYANSLQSIILSTDVLMTILKFMHEESVKDMNEVEKRATHKTEIKPGTYELTFDETEPVVHARKITELLGKMRESFDLLPQAFVIAMVSQYDYLFSKIHRYILTRNPEILEGSDRKLSFKDLVAFSSFEDAKTSLIDKEVESLLRESHHAQIGKLEALLKIPLRKLSVWPEFIEIMERRNIFTHTKGVASSQYMSVCAEHGVSLKEVQIGQALRADARYVRRSHDVLFEMGMKLGYTVWKKLDKKTAPADSYLGDVGYDLLQKKNYELACIMLEFAHGQKKIASDHTRKVNAVNWANAHRLAGRTKKAKEIIDSVDWSSCEDKFKLAAAVIREEYAEAAKFMHLIGKSGNITKLEYIEWPLFSGFRKSNEFESAYREIFGEEYAPPRPVGDLRKRRNLAETGDSEPAQTKLRTGDIEVPITDKGRPGE